MSENKKFIYQSPMNSGILPDLYTGLKYDGSMLFPYLTTPPIQKKYSDSCSSKLKQVVDCLKNNSSECEEIIDDFLHCIDQKK